MPKKTFFNLEENKQTQIINKSIEAFSTASFNEVKIATIIKLSGIPRSSFYDYFEDKLDLYSYIMHMIVDKKKTYIGDVNVSGDFFERLSILIKSGVHFMVDEPELDHISKQFLKDPELIRTIFGEESLDSSDHFVTMLKEGIKDGSVKPDININFIAKTVNILSTELMLEGVHDPDKKMEDIVGELADELIGFIRNGIATA